MRTRWLLPTAGLLVASLALPARAGDATGAFAPYEDLVEVLADLTWHLNDDVYRFPPPKDPTGHDLYQLTLPVELITLSGCSTGLNVVSAGDELIGLARGLMHAGAQSLVLSLWDVHDKSTAEFMTAFYRLLQKGESKAAALRGAMLTLRSSYPHPYQWAPFILVGKT